mgnify:CR=1 FL=1
MKKQEKEIVTHENADKPLNEAKSNPENNQKQESQPSDENINLRHPESLFKKYTRCYKFFKNNV